MPSSDDLERAHQLYVDHEGSHFYLWKADRLEEYQAIGVPEALERVWAVEMREEKLARLGQADSWRTVSFLRGHGFLDDLPALLASRPKGRLWERCTYEEELLRYLDELSSPRVPGPRRRQPRDASPRELAAALESVVASAERIRQLARSDRTRARVDAVADGARLRMAAAQDSPVRRWRWIARRPTTEPRAEPVTR